MSIAAPKALLERVYDEEFGFLLVSSVIKPVHVANGLARGLVGRTYRPVALARLLRPVVRTRGTGVLAEVNPNGHILRDYERAFVGANGSSPIDPRLSRIRGLLLDVVGADDAVFPDPDVSSFGITNERMVTRDPSDGRIGLFLARLLQAGGDGDAAMLMRELLATDADAVTTLSLPVLELTEEPREYVPPGPAALSDHLFAVNEQGEMSSALLRELRRAFDRLARYERSEGSKLNSLRRLVLFGCFAVHVSAITRWSSNPACLRHEHPRPPILFDMFDGERPLTRDASRSTLQAAADVLESLVRERFAVWLEGVIPLDPDDRQAWLAEVPRPVARIFDSVGTEISSQGMAEAMFDAAIIDKREDEQLGKGHPHPLASLVELGRRAGYLTPWANEGRGGRLQKRYHPTAEFLETLVCATVEPRSPVEFTELLSVWRAVFGIVVGRPDDLPIIERRNLGGTRFGSPVAVNEVALRENAEELRRQLVAIGLGKSYADGRTMVSVEGRG